MTARLHLSVALDGAGWHPAAWRAPTARPAELFEPGYWIDLVRTAERGAIDFVTFEDTLTLQSDRPGRPDDRVDQVRGRLDAALLATRVAPATTHDRAGPDGDDHPHRAVPRGQPDLVARSRERRSSRLAGAGPATAPRSPCSVADAATRRAGAGSEARPAAGARVRRGRRRGRGGPASLGQLGGRRRDPGPGDRPVHRPGQAALHRLRGRALLGAWSVHHPAAAAGPAARRRSWPTSPVAYELARTSADVVFVTPHDAR